MKNLRYKVGLGVVLISLFFSLSTLVASELKLMLETIPGVEVASIEHDSAFTEAYEIYFTQLLDHNNPEAGTFKQRVLLAHKGFEQPMVVELQGYQIWTEKQGELSRLLNANQLIIEHRFFKDSRPDSVIDWDKLTVWQAATDQHIVINAIKKFYQKKWLTTGISKGGQTTIFHRYFYPEDVDVSVPYVAPLNYTREDKRIHEHLKSVGTKKERDTILNFQLLAFKNKKALVPLLEELSEEKNYRFKVPYERVIELSILEYSFAYWQWGGYTPKDIPGEKATSKEIFNHLQDVSGFTFFETNSMEMTIAFSYQALKEIGFYSYEIASFEEYLDDTVDVTFDWIFPEMTIEFDKELMPAIRDWIQSDAHHMLFIYGEYDTWAATKVDLAGNTKCLRYILPKAPHSTRIHSFSKEMQEEIISKLFEWMEI